VKRVLAPVAGLLASIALATPASAFSPPELFVRLQTWDTHEAASDWIPLASAPSLDYLAGYDIGYRLQASGEPHEFQRVALTINGVPDGQPTQPSNPRPFCVGRAGTAGDIVEAGPELQFEGDGKYTIAVSLGGDAPDSSACLAGPSTAASFTVTTHVAPLVVGDLVRFRLKPLAGDPFMGVRGPDPPGGRGELRCALDGTVQSDGSVAGSVIVPGPGGSTNELSESAFPRPGAWSCVARGTAEGRDDNSDTTVFATPWSAPVGVEVLSDFRRLPARISSFRSKHPRLNIKAEWPAEARGGRAGIALSRVKGCKGKRLKLRKIATYRAVFGARRARIKLRRPRAGFYLARFSFSGSHFLRTAVDAVPMQLVERRRRLEFADPQEFPNCPRRRAV
jgi:hypothetical protein